MQPFSIPEQISIFFPASRKEGREGSCSTACKGGGAWEGRTAASLAPMPGCHQTPAANKLCMEKDGAGPGDPWGCCVLRAPLPPPCPWGDAQTHAVLGLARVRVDIPKRGVSVLAPLWAGCWTGSFWLPMAAPSPLQELEGISLHFSPCCPYS